MPETREGHGVDTALEAGPGTDLTWRSLVFLLCVPSGFALMAKIYGMMEMRQFVLAVCLPSFALVFVIAWRSSSFLRSDLLIGAVAGLIGAIAYDIVRIPAAMAGYRVFGTISVFGLWLLDAARSSRFTELAGWSYNYFNGICFGIMYAVFMRGRHWLFGVLWAWLLEAIAVVTPFGRIFAVRGSLVVLLIAFSAHVAYGLPLGRAVQNWQDTRMALAEIPGIARLVIVATGLLVLFHPLLSPGAVAADGRARAGQFRIEGVNLNPEWLRIRRGENVTMNNPGNELVNVTLKDSGQRWSIRGGGTVASPPLRPGIYQFFVVTSGRTHSSFVIVEPVESGG